MLMAGLSLIVHVQPGSAGALQAPQSRWRTFANCCKAGTPLTNSEGAKCRDHFTDVGLCVSHSRGIRARSSMRLATAIRHHSSAQVLCCHTMPLHAGGVHKPLERPRQIFKAGCRPVKHVATLICDPAFHIILEVGQHQGCNHGIPYSLDCHACPLCNAG